MKAGWTVPELQIEIDSLKVERSALNRMLMRKEAQLVLSDKQLQSLQREFEKLSKEVAQLRAHRASYPLNG